MTVNVTKFNQLSPALYINNICVNSRSSSEHWRIRNIL